MTKEFSCEERLTAERQKVTELERQLSKALLEIEEALGFFSQHSQPRCSFEDLKNVGERPMILKRKMLEEWGVKRQYGASWQRGTT